MGTGMYLQYTKVYISVYININILCIILDTILLLLSTCRTIDIDVLLAEVGEFGKYQKCYIFLLGLALLFTASSTLSFVFTTGDMNYR